MSHILIVDDSDVIRKVLCRIFDGMKCTTHLAATREQALDIATKMPPDAIIIDWQLPHDGALSLIKAMRKIPHCATSRFYVCSALFSQSERAKINEAGIEDIVLKPFDRHHIWSKFDHLRPAA
jgi:two-component system chemotaxis response regulator CheY